MNLAEILEIQIKKDISDMFIRVNSVLRGRLYSQVEIIDERKFTPQDVNDILKELKVYNKTLEEKKNVEFAIYYRDQWRFRVGIFYQRNTPAIVIRKIDLKIPTFEELNLPAKILENFCFKKRGLILITGTTGSGKSTTIASMIEYMNQNFKRHIMTIEEPIEFTFSDKNSIITQRELGLDVLTYKDALKQFTVHSPDVIYIGNIRDAETCYAALTAAETGVLVLSTLHTVNAVSTIERIINFFPPHQHNLIFSQLSFLLQGVISQRLVRRIDTCGLIPAYEVMALSPSISRLIRENKIWEIPKYIQKGDIYGMKTFNQCLLELIEAKKIKVEDALENSDKKEELEIELHNKGLI